MLKRMTRFFLLSVFTLLLSAFDTVIDYYSDRRLLTGFEMAAFIAWKLIVNSAMIMAIMPATGNTHQ